MKKEARARIFGGTDLDKKYASLKNSKVVILQCPYDLTATYKKGARRGPRAILNASDHMELFDEELKKETYKIGMHTKPPMRLGKLAARHMVAYVEKEVSKVFDANKMPVVIGGEHSVSIGAVRAASKLYDNLSVLHLDAHHDLRNVYEGSGYNHACVGRRFLELCPVVQVGTRSLSKEEHNFLDTKPANLKIMDIYEISKTGSWKMRAARYLSGHVYISIDLDVLDPSIMPSIGTPEPGGIGWHELLNLLKAVTKNRKVVGFDVVELVPAKNFTAPDFLAAKLIYKLLGYIFSGKTAGRPD